MNTPTPTPRTDAATYPADCLGTTLVTNRDCSRALERELTALTADCENETKWAAHYLADSLAAKARAERAEAELATLRAAQKACEACDEPTAFEVRKLRECAARAEAELAAERARLDWVFRNCKVTADDYATGNRDVYAIHDREDLDAAMKGDAK